MLNRDSFDINSFDTNSIEFSAAAGGGEPDPGGSVDEPTGFMLDLGKMMNL
jgi:hypothetical protein